MYAAEPGAGPVRQLQLLGEALLVLRAARLDVWAVGQADAGPQVGRAQGRTRGPAPALGSQL